jgi:hypothetical protein
MDQGLQVGTQQPPTQEMVGATSAPFELGKGATTISFEIRVPTVRALLRPDGQAERVMLRIENVTSNKQAPSFDVYLNVPPGESPEKHPDLYAFTLSTYGLVESSKSRGQHPGTGLSDIQDVTEILERLTAARDWDGKTLRASFVPGSWGNRPIKVKVGRASLTWMAR